MRGCVVCDQRVFMSVCAKRMYTNACTKTYAHKKACSLVVIRCSRPVGFSLEPELFNYPDTVLRCYSVTPRVRPALPCIKSCTVPAVLPNYCRTTATLLLRDLSRQRPERTEVYAIGLPAGSVMSGDGHGFQIDDAHRVGTGVGHIGGVVVGRHESDRDG